MQHWLNIESIFRHHFPDLKEKSEAAIFSKQHPYRTNLRNELKGLLEDRGLNLSIHL